MTKYFLFIFCDKPSSKIEEVMDTIKLVSDCTKSNYLLSDKSNSIIIHFSSEVDINDLREYVYITISQYSKIFFMLECNEKTLLAMSDENLKHLVNLNDKMTDTNNFTYRNNPESLTESQDDEIEENDSDIMALKLLSSVKKNCKLPTLNEILDKISEQGVQSLTELEIQILNTYSKN